MKKKTKQSIYLIEITIIARRQGVIYAQNYDEACQVLEQISSQELAKTEFEITDINFTEWSENYSGEKDYLPRFK